MSNNLNLVGYKASNPANASGTSESANEPTNERRSEARERQNEKLDRMVMFVNKYGGGKVIDSKVIKIQRKLNLASNFIKESGTKRESYTVARL